MLAKSLPLMPKILTGLIGLLIAVESIALFIGTHFVSEGGSVWRTRPNEVFLITDIIGGLLLLIFAVTGGHFPMHWGMVVLTALLMLGHIYRVAEYFMDTKMPFCVGKLLFIFMLIRALVLLLVTIILIIIPR
jgi:hypothetical protein